MNLPAARNVYGQPIVPCSHSPMTGYFRDGCCRTDESDHGTHIACAVVTAEFLAFSKARGNDLSTPRPQWQFPGLKPGDAWCLCISRWVEAYEAGCAPQLKLESTHQRALEYVSLEVLEQFAVPMEIDE